MIKADKVRKPTNRLHVRVDDILQEKILLEAQDLNITKSELVRMVLSKHYEKRHGFFYFFKGKRSNENYTRNVTFTLSGRLHKRIREYCDRTGLSVSTFVRTSCVKCLDEDLIERRKIIRG